MHHSIPACLFLLLPVAGLADAPIADDWARVGYYRDANAALAPSSVPRVVFIGDSITEGWGAEPFIKGHPEYVDRGISGQTTPQLLVRFQTDVVALKPAVVHIMGGTNDVAENTGPETDAEIQGHLTSMVELARASAITVVLASIAPAADFPWHHGLNPAPRIKRLNAWIRDYAAAHGIVYVDYWTALATPGGALKASLSPDGVHPNAAGYAAMQPLANAAIERALKERAESANSPVLRLPPSSLLSKTMSASIDDPYDLIRDEASAIRACPSLQGATDVPAIRQCQAEAFYRTPFYQRTRERYHVSVTPQEVGGVYTEIFMPEEGVASQSRHRVLINLHGGAFDHGARYIARLESMPVAATGRIKVIAIDYRMAPEHAFPAASDDVVAVYRELLKTYRPQNIGIYGCSAGGLLTAQVVARLQKENLPTPAAVGMFCEGASFWGEGDSGALDAAIWNHPVEPSRSMAYLKDADPDDPLAFPAASAQVIARFPPALLISGTRDFALSSVVHTHSLLVAQHVEADLHVWEGMEHSFFLDPDLPQTAEAYSVIARFFEKYLGAQ